MTLKELASILYSLDTHSKKDITLGGLQISNDRIGKMGGLYKPRTKDTLPLIEVDPTMFNAEVEQTLAHELQHHADREKHFVEGDVAEMMNKYYVPSASSGISKHSDSDVQQDRYKYQSQERRAVMREILMRYKQEFDKTVPEGDFISYVEDRIREGKWPNVYATNYMNRLQERNLGDYKKALKELYSFLRDDTGERIGVDDLPSDALLKAVYYKPRLTVYREECYG